MNHFHILSIVLQTPGVSQSSWFSIYRISFLIIVVGLSFYIYKQRKKVTTTSKKTSNSQSRLRTGLTLAVIGILSILISQNVNFSNFMDSVDASLLSSSYRSFFLYSGLIVGFIGAIIAIKNYNKTDSDNNSN